MKPVKLAVSGTGLIGKNNAELVNENDGCHLAGTCDVDAGRKAVGERLNVPFYQDIEKQKG